jgi:sodium/potassium-transporting ATPase subunit alpha
MIFSAAVGLFVTLIPWFNSVFKTQPIPVKYACRALAFGGGLFLFDELRKLIIRTYPNPFLAKIAG